MVVRTPHPPTLTASTRATPTCERFEFRSETGNLFRSFLYFFVSADKLQKYWPHLVNAAKWKIDRKDTFLIWPSFLLNIRCLGIYQVQNCTVPHGTALESIRFSFINLTHLHRIRITLGSYLGFTASTSLERHRTVSDVSHAVLEF
jgi:hypothetical protein